MSDEDLVTQLSELLSGILFETVDPAALNAKFLELRRDDGLDTRVGFKRINT